MIIKLIVICQQACSMVSFLPLHSSLVLPMFYSLIVFFDFTQSLAATVVVAIIIVVS
jgi:hypothetical protein